MYRSLGLGRVLWINGLSDGVWNVRSGVDWIGLAQDRDKRRALVNSVMNLLKLKLNSMARVRERTIPTERPPLVNELSANFCGSRVPRCQRVESLRP
jgi:hypothetical protein